MTSRAPVQPYLPPVEQVFPRATAECIYSTITVAPLQDDGISQVAHYAASLGDQVVSTTTNSQSPPAIRHHVGGEVEPAIFPFLIQRGSNLFQRLHRHPLARLKVQRIIGSRFAVPARIHTGDPLAHSPVAPYGQHPKHLQGPVVPAPHVAPGVSHPTGER